MNEPLPLYTHLIVFAFIASSVLFAVLNNRSNAPQIAIANRWARWFSVAFGLAFLLFEAGWTNRPFWSLAAVFFLLWPLLETLYTWFAISALSQSSLSLFPQFRENRTGEEWPASAKLIVLKEFLKKSGFARTQAVIAEIAPGVNVRATIYENADATIRAQVLFVPLQNGAISHSLCISSETPEGRRLVTDNLWTPYGGFYPENWEVARSPWKRSVKRLLEVHQARIQGLDLEPYETLPLDDINNQQRTLERTNIEAGFLNPIHMQEEMGRISWEGRYRVWKEVWLLNYFGIVSQR